jgi:hypothetical protein
VSPRSLPRCSQPLSTNQTPHPTTKVGATTTNSLLESDPTLRVTTTSGFPHSGRRDSGLVASKPNSVSGDSITANLRKLRPVAAQRLLCTKPAPLQRPGSSRLQVWPNATTLFVVLLRKEVIQPHLPVRLPCYDFVPIADPTFDGSLPKGLGHRLRVLPTFMT